MKNKIIQFTYIFLLIIFSCKNQTYYNEYAIVSAKKEATLAGIKILEMGGNAFDAMIAVDLALAVVYPNAGNLGGGGFLVYRDTKGNIGSLDYREKAPLRASEKMFLDNENNIIPNLSREGAFSVAVPGTPAGLFEIYQRFGSIPLDSIFKPALYLAKDGFKLTKRQANLFNSSKNKILELNNNIELFNNDFHEGFLFKNIQLYKTLLYLLENGLNSFYTGKNAEKIIEYLSSKGGIISQDDLVKYQPIWRDPFVFEYKDLKIITMGLPSSGGIVMNQILKSLNYLDQKSLFDSDLQYVRALVELEKLSFADRSFYLGDPDFIDDSFIDSIVSDNYLLSRFNSIDFENPKKSLEIKHGNFNLNESDETTHYSIVDSFGNAVSVTTTLNSNFGSKLIPPSLGFFLNNEMDDFSIKSGYPNIYGLVGGENNSLVAEKRMLSSMTPTIIEKNNKTYMILGSPGGPTIITSILQTILNVSLFNMNIEEAVNRGRFHHIWLPDKIFYEINTFNEKTKNKLIDIGYKFAETFSSIGRVDAILIENNKIFTAPDPRGDDYSYGK
ncbi:gamma-glutamyltransferase [Flavobacteriales bacterium]|nr:gamma-glutamyltransferase [Flavobacteriales bacterium]